ncbi:hypothetical protein [Neolewinella persica]|uniref:hypothetical protein n=1 Tax=Neolewinella persica TaxID=70998 RepID=UPI0012F878A2|nr:hypothetical protein [Neolewinella persica]
MKALHKQALKDMPNAILLLGYSDEQQREYCRENKINFLDKAGNCFINLPSLRMPDVNNRLIGDLALYADLIRYDDPRAQEAAEKLFDH